MYKPTRDELACYHWIYDFENCLCKLGLRVVYIVTRNTAKMLNSSYTENYVDLYIAERLGLNPYCQTGPFPVDFEIRCKIIS